jgi:hypothetical protein
MPSKLQKEMPSNESVTSSLAGFKQVLLLSQEEIELQVRIAQEAAEMSRTYAARAKETAEKTPKVDVLGNNLLCIGISFLLIVAVLAIVKPSIVQQAREPIQQVR